MSEWIKRLAEKYSEVNEKKLTGNQHKLDMDKDGDIDAKDFAHMRKKKKSGKEEVTMNAKIDADKGAATEEQKEAKGEADALVSSMPSAPTGMLRVSDTTDFGFTHLSLCWVIFWRNFQMCP